MPSHAEPVVVSNCASVITLPTRAGQKLRERKFAVDPAVATDLITLAMAIAAVAAGWLSASIMASGNAEGEAALAAIAPALVEGVLAFLALLAVSRRRFGLWDSAPNAAFVSGLAICGMVIGAVSLSTKSVTVEHWRLASAIMAVVVLAPALVRVCIGGWISSGSLDVYLKRRVAIFGISSDCAAVMAEAWNPSSGLAVVGVFDDRRRNRDVSMPGLRPDGNLDDLAALVRSGAVDDVVVALPKASVARTAEIVNQLDQYPVDVYVAAHMVEQAGLQARHANASENMGSVVFQRINERPARAWQSVLKSALDRASAALFLVGLAPLFAIIAACIKWNSPGPVFFRQKRYGIAETPINVWKFRTMRVTEDGPVVTQATRSDPRVTEVGAILRRTSLDELPQLINVLKGEMSLVGPRPHAIAHNLQYEKIIDGYKIRHKVKPGITGLAQISGCRGETTDPSSMQRRIDHDLHYIRNWSLWADLKILVLTPIRGFVHPNAY